MRRRCCGRRKCRDGRLVLACNLAPLAGRGRRQAAVRGRRRLRRRYSSSRARTCPSRSRERPGPRTSRPPTRRRRSPPRNPEARCSSSASATRDDFEPERARVAAAIAARTAALDGRRLAGAAGPDGDDPAAVAAAMVEGAILASYRFDRFKSKEDENGDSKGLEELTVIGDGGLAEAVEAARIGAEAENFARELQDLPSNVVTPELPRRAAPRRSPTSTTRSRCEVLGREEIAEQGHGRPGRRLAGHRRGAAADRPALPGRRRARPSGWSARASPSTPAASRSSRPPGCRR